jgi:hypothetical protein
MPVITCSASGPPLLHPAWDTVTPVFRPFTEPCHRTHTRTHFHSHAQTHARTHAHAHTHAVSRARVGHRSARTDTAVDTALCSPLTNWPMAFWNPFLQSSLSPPATIATDTAKTIRMASARQCVPAAADCSPRHTVRDTQRDRRHGARGAGTNNTPPPASHGNTQREGNDPAGTTKTGPDPHHILPGSWG